MSWGKVDDNLAFHPKVAMAGNEAMGLWVRAMSYSCQQLTDGFIPHAIVTAMGGADSAEKLVEVGLWHVVEGGYEFNDWKEYQPSGLAEKERRAKISMSRSIAGKKGMSTRWDNKPDNKPITKGITKRLQTDNPEPEPEPEPITTKVVILKPFDDFWQLWPRKEAKANALKAWEKAVRKTTPDEIIAGARRLTDSPYRPETRFIPHAATWLNAERWNDPPPEPSSASMTAARRNLDTVAYFESLEASDILELPPGFVSDGVV